jgi:hypothetical protein
MDLGRSLTAFAIVAGRSIDHLLGLGASVGSSVRQRRTACACRELAQEWRATTVVLGDDDALARLRVGARLEHRDRRQESRAPGFSPRPCVGERHRPALHRGSRALDTPQYAMTWATKSAINLVLEAGGVRGLLNDTDHG